jgi:(S)-ureidoglycine aminohydrolase
MELFGSTRSCVACDHALICPDSFVPSQLPGWTKTQGIILIAPPMGARFTQYLAVMECDGTVGPTLPGVERVMYVLEGTLTVTRPGHAPQHIHAGWYAYLPPATAITIQANTACRLNVFEKPYARLPNVEPPPLLIEDSQHAAGKPFLGDPDAILHTLLPDTLSFDLAVNVFRFQPGAALPLVEIHVMEHGLLMLEGQGIYRLGDSWYPVKAGDVIWMKSFCPQWFTAMGKTPAAYLYYKDVNRDPLGGPT